MGRLDEAPISVIQGRPQMQACLHLTASHGEQGAGLQMVGTLQSYRYEAYFGNHLNSFQGHAAW